MKPTEIANRVTEIAVAAKKMDSPVPRALQDMVGLVHPGAKEIAVLTVVARQQDFEFTPVMEALQRLAAITDWSHDFMVADKKMIGKHLFDWREAPFRKYKSFKDFYRRELEATWGEWSKLQETYAKVMKGEITEEEGRRQVLGNQGVHQGNQYTERKGSNTTFPIGRGRAYILARLDRDGLGELAQKVRVGELSANAAAIEAGFRKKPKRKCPECGHEW